MEEKGSTSAMQQQRRHMMAQTNAHIMQQQQQQQQGGGGAREAASNSAIAAVEARLTAQVAQAAAQHHAHQAAQMAGMAAPPPPLPTLPLSSGSAPLRPATLASTLAGQQGGSGSGGGGGGASSSADLHALEWSDQQFKRAGVHVLPAVDRAHTTPIQNLGMQQRLRHVQMFNTVEKLREGQQHIFLEQLNQMPNVESHTAADYRRIWHAFKNKDEEADHIIAKLSAICDNIDTLNRHANHSH